jgi:GNAT superfamily N-acetyltransferase
LRGLKALFPLLFVSQLVEQPAADAILLLGRKRGELRDQGVERRGHIGSIPDVARPDPRGVPSAGSWPDGSASPGGLTRFAPSDIALLPEYCNRGIGTTLQRELQSEAAAAGTPLRIHVERFNRALRLYERLGFRQIEDKGVYLFMEWSGDKSQAPSSKSQRESFERSG